MTRLLDSKLLQTSYGSISLLEERRLLAALCAVLEKVNTHAIGEVAAATEIRRLCSSLSEDLKIGNVHIMSESNEDLLRALTDMLLRPTDSQY
jgi:hypothetical protein